MQPLHFLPADLPDRPLPGWYTATIATASWRRSSKNNRMVYVVANLDDVAPPYDRIGDYFVLEGVTPRGIACSRRRLVELFRAVELLPKPGDEIRPELLQGRRLEVRLVHETWNGKTRLQIQAYRSLPAATSVPATGCRSNAAADDVARLAQLSLEDSDEGRK